MSSTSKGSGERRNGPRSIIDGPNPPPPCALGTRFRSCSAACLHCHCPSVHCRVLPWGEFPTVAAYSCVLPSFRLELANAAIWRRGWTANANRPLRSGELCPQ